MKISRPSKDIKDDNLFDFLYANPKVPRKMLGLFGFSLLLKYQGWDIDNHCAWRKSEMNVGAWVSYCFGLTRDSITIHNCNSINFNSISMFLKAYFENTQKNNFSRKKINYSCCLGYCIFLIIIENSINIKTFTKLFINFISNLP